MTDIEMKQLETFFKAAKGADVAVSDDFAARVLADAEALQPKAQPIATPAKASFWTSFGGWPALSGVAASGVFGVWMGVMPPASLEDVTAGVFGDSTEVSLLSEYDFLFEEDLIDG